MEDVLYVVALIIGGLGTLSFFLIKNWAKTWDNAINDHNERLGQHDIKIATITTTMDHIKTTGDETREDVKRLLGRQTNGSRSAS